MELSISMAGSAAAMSLVNPKMINHKCAIGLRPPVQFLHEVPSSACSMMFNSQCLKRINHKVCRALQAVAPVQCTENPTEAPAVFTDFHVSVLTEEDGAIKTQIRVTVSSKMTDSIFEKVFSKHVAAAQPLPGFRRMKGGKTPDVPKEVALHLIGPSKVKKAAIKKIINHAVAEYVEKEKLDTSKNLKVLQSYEELEAAFEPGKEFCFDAAVHLAGN
ncbi:trigger factor-like [Lolium rigidum]|uniref:trigger factor-like n=1 Tax=Lolium rigidum TaxID=89674 RepID=UPI001F5D7E4F|nr:trigger factor-like [Lolium rigidum]